MITTEQDTKQGVAEPETAPVAAPVATRPDTRMWLGERISTETAALMGATWWVLFLLATGLEPRTTAAAPVLATVFTVMLFGLLLVTTAGLLARYRWGLLASLGAASLFTALAVACPTTGHHPIGAWWFGQMACVLALVAASAYALRRPAASS